MKVKLYKKFVSFVCKALKVTRKQLFSREYENCVLPNYTFNFRNTKGRKHFVKSSSLSLLTHLHPLSQIWKAYDYKTSWLLKYWKHSHWKHVIRVKLDLGEDLYEVIANVLNNSKI